ncbi:MAG: hypothetical protein WA667_08870 [Candidatus Nitrosopolaris sp.]
MVIGFGSHNATEGFGIAGPLTGLVNKPRIRFLILAGLVGGGPTFVGTVLGSLWTSTITSVFFLSIAGGALIYVSMLMYNSGRKQTTNDVRHFRRAMCRFCYRSNSYTWRSMTCIVQVNKQSIKELV